MRKYLLLLSRLSLFIFLSLIFTGCHTKSTARYNKPHKTTPMQFSFWPGTQFPDDPLVTKFKFGLPISSTESIVNGIDVAVFFSLSPEVGGIQNSIMTNFSKQVIGMQNSLANVSAQEMNGTQIGLFNSSFEMFGAQFGVVNINKKIEGTQFGLINSSREMYGIQFGLLNFIKDGPLPFMPFINMHF